MTRRTTPDPRPAPARSTLPSTAPRPPTRPRTGRQTLPRAATWAAALLATAAWTAACGSEGGGEGTSGSAPSTYAFTSHIGEGSSVSYGGQVHRQVLISDLSSWIAGLTADIDGGQALKAGDVEAGCDFYYAYDASVGADTAIRLTTDPAALQTKLGDLGSKNLSGKLAGNDPKGQHKDFTKALAGWAGQTSAEGLLRSWFKALDAAAVARVAGNPGKAPDGSDLKVVHVTAEGLDLQQLIAKFLGVAVSFSQGADDYLDDDLEGKGLLSDNTKPESDGANYTALEHHWDEGFGYFGAARDYGDYSDDELAAKGGREGWSKGWHDTDGDGKIDLKSELNFGHSTNAAKRDRGAKDLAATDFTRAAWDGFVRGRHLITSAAGALTPAQLDELRGYRNQAVQAWESAIAATVVHYINDTLADMAAFGTADYDFYDHAKHWSELKGFALGLQFNRRSPLKDFAKLHTLIGDKPVLSTADAAQVTAYAKALREARALVGAAYGFDAKLLGDDKGAGGW